MPGKNLDVLRLGRLGHFQRLLHQFPRGEQTLGRGRILPGQIRQPLHQRPGLPGCVVNFQHIIIDLLVRGQLFQGHHAVAHNGHQQIIEFMGDARCQGAHDLQPLMVGQLLQFLIPFLHSGSFLLQQLQMAQGLGLLPAVPEHGNGQNQSHTCQHSPENPAQSGIFSRRRNHSQQTHTEPAVSAGPGRNYPQPLHSQLGTQTAASRLLSGHFPGRLGQNGIFFLWQQLHNRATLLQGNQDCAFLIRQ